MDIQPRHVICVLSSNQFEIRALCAKYPGFIYDEEYSHNHYEEGMVESFEASKDRLFPSFTDSDIQAIESHSAVNYILSPPMRKGEEVEVSKNALAFVADSFSFGALAVKGESSGIAHGKERWLELHEQTNSPDKLHSVLYRAWVRLPISEEDKLYSVGMHLIGLKDTEIEVSEDAVYDLDSFLLYLVVDQAEPNIKDGQSFSKNQESIIYFIKSKKCQRYEEDEFFYNPYGIWSLTIRNSE
ncbi:MAG: hypothetical protein HWE27_16865 [Gammaproteobacteria bacterium]|nr:hypothetical protein [Gammaproteobacteria bacterium]